MKHRLLSQLPQHSILLFVLMIPMVGLHFLPSDDAYDHFITTKFAIDSLLGKSPYTFDWVLNPIYKTVFILLGFLYALVQATPFAHSFPFIAFAAILTTFYFLYRGALKLCFDEKVPDLVVSLCAAYACITFYSPMFYWGFMSFLFGIPFAIYTFFAFNRLFSHPTARDYLRFYLFFTLSYFSHPLTLFFLGIYLGLRVFFSYFHKEPAKIPTLNLILSGFYLLALHKSFAYSDMAMEKKDLLNSFFHPFRPLSDFSWMYKNTFFTAEVWFPAQVRETHFLWVIPLMTSLFLVLFAISKKNRRDSFPALFFAVVFGHLVFNFFIDTILPLKLPFILFYRHRLEAFVNPMLILGLLVCFIRLAQNRFWRYEFVLGLALFCLTVHQMANLRRVFVTFDENARAKYETHTFKIGWNNLLPNQRYSFNHIRKTHCLWENVCHPEIFEEEYFLATNKSGIIPLVFRGLAETK